MSESYKCSVCEDAEEIAVTHAWTSNGDEIELPDGGEMIACPFCSEESTEGEE